jgi:hypothetical protein
MRNNPLLKRLPVTGDVLNALAALHDGQSLPDVAAKTATQHAGAVAGAAAGGAVCGGAAAATLGLGAATCPVLIAGGGAVGDYVFGKAYDPFVKPVVHVAIDGGKKLVDEGKKVIHFLGG